MPYSDFDLKAVKQKLDARLVEQQGLFAAAPLLMFAAEHS